MHDLEAIRGVLQEVQAFAWVPEIRVDETCSSVRATGASLRQLMTVMSRCRHLPL